MPTELHLSQNLPSTGTTNEPLTSQHHAQERAQLLQALQSNDWAAFEDLALEQDNGIDLEAERYFDGKNCLHVAITAGSHTLATNLATLCAQWDFALIDTVDDSGHTPIMYAAESPSDNVELMDALISAGASVGLSDALKSASERGHAGMTQRLLASNVDVPQVLAEIIHDSDGQTAGLNAAKLLISLGADATQALGYAAQRQWLDAARALILLGSKGSDSLVLAATQPTANATNRAADQRAMATVVKNLIRVGSCVARALTTVAKNPDSAANSKTAKLLIQSDESLSANRYMGTAHDNIALLNLAKTGNTAALCTLAGIAGIDNATSDKLIANRNIDALKTLINAGLVDSEKLLKGEARAGNLLGIKTLIAAGAKTSSLLKNLYLDWKSDVTRNPEAIKVLVAAGADPSPLPQGLRGNIDKRQMEISQLSTHEKNDAVVSSAKNRDLAELIWLLDSGADPVSALQTLSQAKDLSAIRVVLNASMNATELLIDRVKAGDIDVARTLIEAKDIPAETFTGLIENGDLELARTLVSIEPTQGRQALVLAIQEDDTELAKGLLEMGADGPGALLSLLESSYREVALNLVALGVDTHTTLMRAVTSNSLSSKADLLTIGAELPRALTRAIELGHAETAKKILDQHGESIGRDALLNMLDDEVLSDEAKSAGLTHLLQLEFNKDAVLKKLIDNGNTPQLKMLITLGAPTDDLLMAFGKEGNRIDARKLILAGADYINPIKTLQANHEQDAVTLLGLALAGARDSMMAAQSDTKVRAGLTNT